MKVLIVVLALAVAINARPQSAEYDDYDQEKQQPAQQPQRPAARAQQPAQKQQAGAISSRNEDRETTTWIPIIQYDKEQGVDGSYKTHYETGNNINAQESGYLKDITEDNPTGTLVQKGSYSYESPDGELINVEYQADENGFRVTGDHLPTPPPVSPEIQKGLDLIYAGIKIQEERRRSNPNYAADKEERDRLNYLGLYIGN